MYLTSILQCLTACVQYLKLHEVEGEAEKEWCGEKEDMAFTSLQRCHTY